MMKRFKPLIVCLCIALLFMQGCGGNKGAAELEFAKNAYRAMIAGDPAAGDAIAWEHFEALGVNFGQIYASMPDATSKAAMKTGFLTSFASTAKQTGLNADSIQNWQVASQEGDKTVISADGPKGKFSLTVSNIQGAPRITAFTQG